MTMIEVDETRLKKLLTLCDMEIECGLCPMEYCGRKYEAKTCRDALYKWLTEKPIGHDVEDDGR